jgi:hypothetical protein
VSSQYGDKVRIKLITLQKKARAKKDLKEKVRASLLSGGAGAFRRTVVDNTNRKYKNGGDHV